MGCYNSIVINAPIEKVWGALRDFHDMGWAKGVVEGLDKVGDKKADQIGARRILNGAFHETLLSLDDRGRSFTYSIDDGPEATSKDKMSGYVGRVEAHEITNGNGTFVAWSSQWADSQGGVKEFCDPVYQALLNALKTHFS